MKHALEDFKGGSQMFKKPKGTMPNMEQQAMFRKVAKHLAETRIRIMAMTQDW